jgi:hypothetical protein
MKQLVWHTEKRKLGELIEHSYNPRILTGMQKDFLQESLERFGLVEIPAINTDNTLLAGHQRSKIMLALYGADYEIDVRVPSRELTQKEADEYLIRSNKNTASWDNEILIEYFSEDELEAFGFTVDEIVDLAGFEFEELPDIDIQGFQYEETKFVKLVFDTAEEMNEFKEKYKLKERQRVVNYEQVR